MRKESSKLASKLVPDTFKLITEGMSRGCHLKITQKKKNSVERILPIFFWYVSNRVYSWRNFGGGRDMRRTGTGWHRHQTPQGWDARQSTQMYYKQVLWQPFSYILKKGKVQPRQSLSGITVHQPLWDGTSPTCDTHHQGNWRGNRGVLRPSELQPQHLHTEHRWPASPTPLEQLPPTATWCQQWILHPHASK